MSLSFIVLKYEFENQCHSCPQSLPKISLDGVYHTYTDAENAIREHKKLLIDQIEGLPSQNRTELEYHELFEKHFGAKVKFDIKRQEFSYRGSFRRLDIRSL